MKTFAGALATHYALGTTTLATAVKVTRESGAVIAFTSHDIDDPIDGVTYLADPGLDASNIVTVAGLSVSNLEMTILNDGTFSKADIFNGLWRNASFDIFRYNYKDLTGGTDPLLSGTLGELGINITTIVVELRSLVQYLQQNIVSYSSRTCRYRLGSTDKYQGGLCNLDISGSPFTVSFAVTSVIDNQIFIDSAQVRDDDWFGEGSIHWLTGANVGARRKVKSYDGYLTNGKFTLAEKMYKNIQVGDTGIAVAGCRKRWEEDCKEKFDNLLNFGGEKDRKGLNDLIKGTAVDV